MEHEPEHEIQNSAKKGNQVLGQIAALGMGGIVVAINKEHGPLLASIAGIKQYVYSSVIAVLLIGAQHKIYDHLKKNKPDSALPAILSIAPRLYSFTYKARLIRIKTIIDTD